MKLGAKLQGARIVGAGHLSEVRVGGVLIEAVIACAAELGVVENVEELEAQFQTRQSSLSESNGFVEGPLKLTNPGPTTASFPALPKPWPKFLPLPGFPHSPRDRLDSQMSWC